MKLQIALLGLLLFPWQLWSMAQNEKKTRAKSNEIVWNGITINSYPADNPVLNKFYLYQSSLGNLACYVDLDNRSYDIHGRDNNGDAMLSSHYTSRYDRSYIYNRSDRDAVVAANTVLRRYIQAGICSSSKSKFYKVYTECESSEEPKRCERRKRESEYW